MSEPSICPAADPLAAAQQTIIFAFDLADKSLLNLPANLAEILQGQQVQNALRTTLTTLALPKKAGDPPLSEADARKLGEALLSKTGDTVKAELIDKVKKSAQFQNLDKSLKDFVASLKCTPMGVWVDHNKGVLYIVGAALAVGGSLALYFTKTSGPVIDFPIDQIKGKPLQVLKVGKFSLDGQLIEFKPESQTLGAGLIATQQWQQVKLEIKLGVVAAATDVKQVSGQAIVTSDSFHIKLDGSATPEEKKVNLGLGFNFKGGGLPGPLNISVGAMFSDKTGPGGQLSAGMKTGVGTFGLKSDIDRKQYNGMVTWEIPLSL